MTRTAARELAVQLVFRLAQNPGEAPDDVMDEFFDKEYFATLSGEEEISSEYPDEIQMGYIRRVASGASENRDELDSYIEKYSKGWKVSRISKTALAVLRTAIYEILYMDDVPTSAAINEAVELSKGYEEQETVAFINGILGSFVRGELENEESDAAPEQAQ